MNRLLAQVKATSSKVISHAGNLLVILFMCFGEFIDIIWDKFDRIMLVLKFFCLFNSILSNYAKNICQRWTGNKNLPLHWEIYWLCKFIKCKSELYENKHIEEVYQRKYAHEHWWFCHWSVSYTHLDVYKRQPPTRAIKNFTK